ncbi:MAG: N-acetyltransferase family protein, partial [Planctomycetota bacterium]
VATPYSERECYSGIREFSIYVESQNAGKGVGRVLMSSLIERAQENGCWKLLSRVFPDNTRCRRLLKRCGFREVGVYENHGQLCGEWRDVVIVERLLINQSGE